MPQIHTVKPHVVVMHNGRPCLVREVFFAEGGPVMARLQPADGPIEIVPASECQAVPMILAAPGTRAHFGCAGTESDEPAPIGGLPCPGDGGLFAPAKEATDA